MTENKRFQIIHLGNPYDFVVKDHNTNKTYGTLQGDDKSLMELLNELHEENEQLKQDNFICLDCKHSGYTEIGCLCEKKDRWTDYKTECEDYEEYDW